jgi:hypothetical protein
MEIVSHNLHDLNPMQVIQHKSMLRVRYTISLLCSILREKYCKKTKKLIQSCLCAKKKKACQIVTIVQEHVAPAIFGLSCHKPSHHSLQYN